MTASEIDHERAMDLAERALLARRKGQTQKSQKLLRQAYDLEAAVATQAVTKKLPEPSRSILLRSAAALALQCEEENQAERFAALGLAEDPPAEIAEQLRDLLEQVHFSRHLRLRGIHLQPEDIQLSLSGREVSLGLVSWDELLKRVDAFKKLFRRTGDQLMGLPFQVRGRPASSNDFRVYMSLPRAASFAVTLRIGRSAHQPELTLSPAVRVIDEICTRLKLFDDYADTELQERIADETYFVSFLSLAKELAPSGDTVRQTGLTVIRDGTERRVQITRTRKTVASGSPPGISDKPAIIMLTGTLLYADATQAKMGTIKLRTDDNDEVSLKVPKGMLDDVVKPYWDEYVRVAARQDGNQLVLEDIEVATH